MSIKSEIYHGPRPLILRGFDQRPLEVDKTVRVPMAHFSLRCHHHHCPLVFLKKTPSHKREERVLEFCGKMCPLSKVAKGPIA